MTKGGSVTNAIQVMAMLKASHLPTAIGIIHCRSHQTDESIVSKGNNQADKETIAVELSAIPGVLQLLELSMYVDCLKLL